MVWLYFILLCGLLKICPFQELEPFPELGIFDDIRKFHVELCHDCSIGDLLLKVNVFHTSSHFMAVISSVTFDAYSVVISYVDCLFSVFEEVLLSSTKDTFLEVILFRSIPSILS